MRIGRLAERTGIPARLLRYYEEQGLITPARSANGYRDYAESQVARVQQIRDLLDAGIPTRIIRQILPCVNGPREANLSAEMLQALETERDRMTARIDCLTRNRDAIAGYLEAVRPSGDHPGQHGSGLQG